MNEDASALAARYHTEIFEARRFDVADEIIGPSFTMHAPGVASEMSHGPEGVKGLAAAMGFGLPDLRITHHDVIADGDKVLIRWEMTGTHQGELFGVPASGHPLTITGLDLFRIESGRIVELWQGWDQFGMLQQIGAILSPAPV